MSGSKDVINLHMNHNFIEKGTYFMDTDIRKLLKEIAAEDLIELFAPCMDDYLYIIDLQKILLKFHRQQWIVL